MPKLLRECQNLYDCAKTFKRAPNSIRLHQKYKIAPKLISVGQNLQECAKNYKRAPKIIGMHSCGHPFLQWVGEFYLFYFFK